MEPSRSATEVSPPSVSVQRRRDNQPKPAESVKNRRSAINTTMAAKPSISWERIELRKKICDMAGATVARILTFDYDP